MTEGRLRWAYADVSLEVTWAEDRAPELAALRTGAGAVVTGPGRPLVELLTVGAGHSPSGDGLVRTVFGGRARYVDHRVEPVPGGEALVITVADAGAGLTAHQRIEVADGTAVVRGFVEVVNDGAELALLRSVTSWVTRLGRPSDRDEARVEAAPISGGGGVRAWSLRQGRNDWLGEGRWTREPADAVRFPDLAVGLTGGTPRGAYAVASRGTWSTGRHLPTAALEADGLAWAWQVEHNGGWRWEIGDDGTDGYLALGGPTDTDHQWLHRLAPGATFRSVAVAVTVAADLTTAIGQLTTHRRRTRRRHPDNAAPAVVFNDYMNTLNGDPTTERLMPLIDAAASVGAEVFCVDAGWYDDSGHWWDTVGAWQPSTRRFPGGLREVTDRIRARGMVPGLWLEPEVVGVASPVADTLPPEAFFQRAGARVVDSGRFHLDLRHPAARAHLDAVVDRLIADFGVGFFTLDYNIDPGAGTDLDAASPGDGLLGHNRAHLAWLDAVLDRHPGLIVENCGSGAMRADAAILSRLQLQSTSDQQDPLRYPPIAAAAPMAMLPEQAANWAYPQPDMTHEEIAFTLATGLAGRLYLSGHVDGMAPDQLALVREAVALAGRLKTVLPAALPHWPLGLPGWDDPWVALAYATPGADYLTVWSRDPASAPVDLDLGLLATRMPVGGADPVVETIFPAALPPWSTTWSGGERRLRVGNPTGVAAARMFRITTTT